MLFALAAHDNKFGYDAQTQAVKGMIPPGQTIQQTWWRGEGYVHIRFYPFLLLPNHRPQPPPALDVASVLCLVEDSIQPESFF